MKKLQLVLLVLGIGIIVSCNENKKSNEHSTEDEFSVNDKVVNEEEPVIEIDESTQRFKLLGMWQDVNDPDYKMEITATKFKNYIAGDNPPLNWNQDYVLSSSSNTNNIVADDNGSFIMVYNKKREVFYSCQVIELTPDFIKIISQDS